MPKSLPIVGKNIDLKRLFIGIKIPDEVSKTLSPLQSGVREARFSPIENFHITLRFIGDLDLQNTEELAQKLYDIKQAPFYLKLRGVGFFGHERPHSIHANLEESESLFTLAKKCESACRKLGHEPESRKYTPHVTLAYLGRNAELRNVIEWQARNNLYKSAQWQVDRFYLFSSYMGNGPSYYEIEAEYELAL